MQGTQRRQSSPGRLSRHVSLALALMINAAAFAAEEAPVAEEVDFSRLIFEAQILVLPGEAPAAVTQAGGATPLVDGTPTLAPDQAGPAIRAAAEPAPDPTAIARYEREISGALENTGPYSDQLREQYQSLGELYQRSGEHEKAITNFENAMHIDRVNDGLFTLRQLPLVENIIESYTALNDVEEVDGRQEYLFYIQQKSYAEDDPRLLAAKEKWADWNVESYLKTGPKYPGPSRGMVLSNQMNRQDFVAIQNPRNGQMIFVPRNQMPTLLSPYGSMTGMAGADLYTRGSAFAVAPEMVVDERLRRARDIYEEIIDSPNEDYQSASGQQVEYKLANIAYAVKQQMDELQGDLDEGSLSFNRPLTARSPLPLVTQAYTKSRESLEQIASDLEDDPAGDPLAIAQAYINLGDLHYGFDRVNRGKEAYAKALAVLMDAQKSPQEISAAFNPNPLVLVPGFALHPYTRAFFGMTDEDRLVYKGYMDVTLSVRESGDVRGARIIAETENTSRRMRVVLMDYLREHRMRPIVQNGEIVDEYPMTLRVHYSY